MKGFLPREPEADASPKVRGCHALTLMLLFRPYRLMHDFVIEVVGQDVVSLAEDDAWRRISDEYVRWRKYEIDEVAAPYLRRDVEMLHPFPEFDSKVWWACMISQKLRNYDMARNVHLQESYAQPRDLSHLPDYEDVVSVGRDGSVEHCVESDVEQGSSSSSSDMSSCCDIGASAGPPNKKNKTHAIRCATVFALRMSAARSQS